MSTTKGTYAIAGLWQETNTYAPRQTTIEDFESFELESGDAVKHIHHGIRSVIGGAMDTFGESVKFGLSAGAWPSGTLVRETAERLVEDFEQALKQVGSIQGLVLNLHGAMVADGLPDIEYAVVSATRRLLGSVPIVAVLDLHANPSSQLLSSLDGVVAYRTFPHVDMYERGVEAARLVRTIAENGESHEVTFAKLPLITSPLSQGTELDPMRSLIKATDALAPNLKAFVTPGFPYSDVTRAGMSIMVNSRRVDRDEARTALGSLTTSIQDNIGSFRIPAVSRAVARKQMANSHESTMLVDVGDNVGGGTGGQSTALLSLLMEYPDRKSLMTFCSPTLASRASELDQSGFLDVSFNNLRGGVESASFSIISVSSGVYRSEGRWMGGRTFSMGRTAVLRHRKIFLMITSIAVPPFHREQVTSQGMDPKEFDFLTAKGALAWQDAFGADVQNTIYIDTPGETPAFPEDLIREQHVDDAGNNWVFPGGRGVRVDSAGPPNT